jgi:uncharacterized protein (TIGR03066 family)
MSTLRWLAVGVVIVAFGSGARADDKPDYAKLLVGKWEVSKADEGTIPVGAMVEFTRDGKIKFGGKKDGEEMMFEGTYKVEGDAFVMTVKLGDQEKTQKITITKITDKEMATKGEDGKLVELTKKK